MWDHCLLLCFIDKSDVLQTYKLVDIFCFNSPWVNQSSYDWHVPETGSNSSKI